MGRSTPADAAHEPAVENTAEQDVRFHWLIPFFFLGTLVFAMVGGGSAMRYLYPAAAGVIALAFYWRAPVTYVSFIWWLWFLSPFIRRVVDYRSGWVDPSPMLLAPPLATLVCAPSLLRFGAIWRKAAPAFHSCWLSAVSRMACS